MKATNTLTQREKQPFSVAITGDKLQNLIRKSVASPEAAARFTGTLISAVASNKALQDCNPATVVAAALRGEGMGLTLGREYHLIPFGNTCAYVIGFKGLIALCLAGNDVADMDCVEVREGEYMGRDKRTKRPVFDFSIYETDEEAAKHPVIGYMAYCEMKSGYFRAEYMTVDEILAHAERYSKAFDVKKFKKLQNGELSPQETERLMNGSPYYSAPETMMRKTVLRKLLNSGYIRLANSAAIRDTMQYENSLEDGIIPGFEIGEQAVVEGSGEVIDVEVLDADIGDAEPAPAKRSRKKRDENPPSDADYEDNFFGGAE